MSKEELIEELEKIKEAKLSEISGETGFPRYYIESNMEEFRDCDDYYNVIESADNLIAYLKDGN